MKQVIQHINYACWPQCLHSDGLRVGGNTFLLFKV